MKRLLVISDPPASPGYLPRLRYLCDFLVQKGYDVTLLTEQYEPLRFEHSYPIITIPMYSGEKMDWFCKTLWTLLTDWHNRAFARKALTQYLSPSTETPFDAVLCSTFSDFPLGAALQIARTMNVPLICDIRDLDEQVEDSQYQYRHQSKWLMPFRRIYRAIHIGRRNKVLRQANTITTVSPWHADFIRTFNTRVHVIYNGYDPAQFYPADIPTDTFRITYIGSLFAWQEPALAIVQQAIKELNEPSIILDIHTPQHNLITHDALGDAIRQSSIMLVLTNTQTHGMLTTKFYEALGCEKPVLCVPSDQGALAELIAYTHAGIATDDIEAIRNFIADRYAEWQQNGFTRQHTQQREQFSRENQCAQLEKLL